MAAISSVRDVLNVYGIQYIWAIIRIIKFNFARLVQQENS